ncbi:MAG: hypothetical protein JO360_13295 [Acidobacteria bacterium]|nr:hypothetical protein [Acidobacteriota bacterium]
MVDISAQTFVQLYSKLAATFSVRDAVGDDSPSMLSVMIPGLYINQHLDVNDPQTQYYISNALSPTLECSWILREGVGTVTDIYKSILDGKETPLVSLTPGQKQELDEAMAYLFLPDDEPTPAYEAYQTYELKYLEALDAYEQAWSTEQNGGANVPPNIIAELELASTEWTELGHKGDVERALRIVSEYEALEPALYWARLADLYRRWTRVAGTDSEFQLIHSLPPYEQWFSEFGWTDFHFDDKDFANQQRSGAVGTESGCSCGCPTANPPPGFLASASGDFRRDARRIEGEPLRFVLACRLRRVEIIRPWMNTDLFFSRAWRWSPASVSYGNMVSTGGDLAGSVVPTGRMPVLPQTAVLARDVKIEWQDDGTLFRELAAQAAAGDELAFGPFRLTGAAFDSGHIDMPDPQLFGFLSVILPKCPNPDPNLQWPEWQIMPSMFPRISPLTTTKTS